MNDVIDWLRDNGQVVLAALGLAAVLGLPMLLDRDGAGHE